MNPNRVFHYSGGTHYSTMCNKNILNEPFINMCGDRDWMELMQHNIQGLICSQCRQIHQTLIKELYPNGFPEDMPPEEIF